MKLLFVWTGVTGYTGDCWRALNVLPDVETSIWVQAENISDDTRFQANHELRNLDARIVPELNAKVREEIIQSTTAFQPDLMFLVGWHASVSRFFATRPVFRKIPKVIIFDLPFEWTIRKLGAPVVLLRYLRRFTAAFVPGAAATTYARWLGFGSRKRPIFTGMFSTNLKRFEGLAVRKIREGIPRRFLFVGRYVPEKNLALLVEAYRLYREQVSDPWPLDCVGMGPDGHLLLNQPGITDCGFCEPDALPGVYGSHGVFVLPSRHEPWGVVLAEAAGAGLPIICTDACGAHLELVRDNGVVCPSGDAKAMAGAMVRMHQTSQEDLETMIREGVALAEPYSCEAWAQRVVDLSRQLLSKVK